MQELDQTQELIQMLKERLNEKDETIATLQATIEMDLCQYFEHKKLKGYADFFNSSSSFCCGVI